jgi:hypothetical protein
LERNWTHIFKLLDPNDVAQGLVCLGVVSLSEAQAVSILESKEEKIACLQRTLSAKSPGDCTKAYNAIADEVRKKQQPFFVLNKETDIYVL